MKRTIFLALVIFIGVPQFLTTVVVTDATTSGTGLFSLNVLGTAAITSGGTVLAIVVVLTVGWLVLSG